MTAIKVANNGTLGNVNVPGTVVNGVSFKNFHLKLNLGRVQVISGLTRPVHALAARTRDRPGFQDSIGDL